MSGKLTRIQELIAWSCSGGEFATLYKQAVAGLVRRLTEKTEFIPSLNYLEGEWRDKRNQLMHALFNKNPEAMYSELLLLVEQGYQAARQLDNAVRFVKRANIREKFKIQ